ncbi:MAG: hypothetical protein RLY20_3329 [Verrucomicrobiota bacterium]|jgi:hypothetical protein
MHDDKIVQRFIELRAQGRTFAELTSELGVSKPTLIAWSRKHQFQIQNLKQIELEALAVRWLASITDRVNALGGQLQKIEAELATREVKELGTVQLYSLARSLRRQIAELTGSVQFTSSVRDIPDEEYHDQVQDWPG